MPSFISGDVIYSRMYSAGLVLEGGSMRGVYTAGAVDAFLDNDIAFSSVYGVSAGACHGASFVSKQRGRAFRVNVDYLDDKHYCSLYSLVTTGNLFGADMLFNKIPNELDLYDYAAFNEWPGKFVLVVTNVETGEAEYIQMTEEYLRHKMAYMQATCSMPLVARIVEVDGRKYLDGCIADSIPIRRSIADGNQKTVVVRTRSREYRKEPNPLMPVIRLKYRAYPKFVAGCAARHIQYNASVSFLEAEEKAGRAFILAPTKDVGVGSVCKDRKKLEALYELGYQDAAGRMDELRAFLDE